jgi:hypothetical protein
MSLTRFAPLAAAAISGSAFAGIVGGSASIDFMQVGRGYLDFQDPFEGGSNTATIANPPVGSFLRIGGGIPDVERFLSTLVHNAAGPTAEGFRSTFFFRNEIEVDPFALPEFEHAFAGNRLSFTTSADSVFTASGFVGLSGAAALFFNYSDPQSLVIMDVPLEEYSISIGLEAGNHTIAWGVLADPSGGMGDWDGSASLLVVPAPGAAALLALAGLVLGHRRRR